MNSATDSMAPLEGCRDHFPSLKRSLNGKPPVYMDNACTTLVPYPVIDAMSEYYTNFPACGGRRSHHWFSYEVTERIEGDAGARKTVAGFINAASADEILFTTNTTHAINLVSLGYNLNPGDTVLVTDREHNSNLIPWLRLQKEGRIRLEILEASPDGCFDLDAFERKLKTNRIRLVSMAYTSNITAYSLPAEEIVKIAHQHGARVLLDGAQKVPHQAVNVQSLDVDFLAFSLHKMCGPRGVGVLYAKKELLNDNVLKEGTVDGDMLRPVILGGGTIQDTTYDAYSLLTAPERFEAGIQNYSGIIASGAAVRYIRQLGMERIADRESSLNRYLTEEMLSRYGDAGWFRIIGPRDASLRSGILTFEVQRPNAVGLADELNRRNNIMIRDGVFCVHSYFNARFGTGWLHPRSHKEHRMIYRVSLYFYNTLDECRIFLETLDEIFRERCYI